MKNTKYIEQILSHQVPRPQDREGRGRGRAEGEGGRCNGGREAQHRGAQGGGDRNGRCTEIQSFRTLIPASGSTRYWGDVRIAGS